MIDPNPLCPRTPDPADRRDATDDDATATDLSERRNPLGLLRHDLCTPLNAILGFSDLLAENAQLSERHRRYAAHILAAGTDLLRTINALLDQARTKPT
jgi:signal transduction histidine kinase